MITLSDASQSVGLFWTSDQVVSETCTEHSQQRYIHASGGIQTQNISRRAAESPRLRPSRHWDRHQSVISIDNHNHTDLVYWFLCTTNLTERNTQWDDVI
jgi:hypothetical protein